MQRALRPLARLAASTPSAAAARRIQPQAALRTFATSARRASDHGPAPSLYGAGSKDGEIATDLEQATGLERLQLLGLIEGVDVFDQKPLDASRVGTLDNPILVPSYDVQRQVGCTGSPADSHDLIWLTVNQTLKNHRCPECGSVYRLDFKGEHHDEHHH